MLHKNLNGELNGSFRCHSQMWVAPGKITIMKSLILITFILFPILERAQTYELVNSTTTEEPKSHHLGFASVDLENEDESDSGCEGYGCDNAPGYGAPSPSYKPPTPSYGYPEPEPAGSGADSMLNSVSIHFYYIL